MYLVMKMMQFKVEETRTSPVLCVCYVQRYPRRHECRKNNKCPDNLLLVRAFRNF